MSRQNRRELTGLQKAAVLLISLGPEMSSKILKHMRDDEIEQLTLEIANMRRFPDDIRDKVFEEFQQLCTAQQYLSQGGIQYAREVLEKALGPQKAAEIINRLTVNLQVRPFDFVRKTDPAQLLNFIQGEHPQTIALILAYLSPEQAAIVMSGLPPERQIDVAKRIALMDRTSPEVIREVEQVLERKLSTMVTQDFTSTGGV
ncbi:MAG TPA: flagellar motor switch protein FliG, partial [Clostridia bacterium]|nr:flagellar motor switch protein FliG [Clostridia bacterium]